MASPGAPADPRGAEIDRWLTEAGRCRAAGRLDDAVAAVEQVLRLDPLHLPALLAKGSLLTAMGRRAAAARTWADALKTLPPGARVRPELGRMIEHARTEVAAEAERLRAHLMEAVAPLRAEHGAATHGRFDEALAIFAGAAKPYPQAPLLLHYPRLPAIPFHDRARFPWLGELEAGADTIRAELEAGLAAHWEAFQPYIDVPPGRPVSQWVALNRSRDWATLYLWRDGVRQDAVTAHFPETAALLERLPMLEQQGLGPTAMFSALAPRTRIPPHTGSTNTRLIVHLPLVLPGPAFFRVGAETRRWAPGEAWVFDDTIEHEAWNDAEETRIILIFDVWHPDLDLAERAMVEQMMLTRRAYYAAEHGGEAG